MELDWFIKKSKHSLLYVESLKWELAPTPHSVSYV